MFLRFFVVLLLLAFALIGCAPAANVTPTPSQAQPAQAAQPAPPPAAGARSVRFATPNAGAVNAPIYIAESLGYFADQGISLEYVFFPSASEIIPALSRGDVDVAAVGINPASLNALAGNFGIKLVADVSTQFPGFPINVLVVRKDIAGAVTGPADLRGRKIALTPPGLGTAGGFLLSRYLAQANLTPNDVDIVPLPFPEQVAALVNGSVDGALMTEPFATQVITHGAGSLLITTDHVVPNHQVAGLVYTERFSSAERDLGTGFMIAYLKGVRVFMSAFGEPGTDKDGVIQILTRRTDIKDPLLWADMYPTGASPDGQLNLQSISESQTYFQQLGLIQSTPPVNSLVDASFAQAAVQTLGSGQPPAPAPPS